MRTRQQRSINRIAAIKAAFFFVLLGQTSCQSNGEYYVGIISPSREALIAAPLSAKLKELRGRRGDHVNAGDILALLDDEEQAWVTRAAMLKATAKGRLELAALHLEDARLNYVRTEELVKASAFAADTLHRAELALKTRTAELRVLREAAALDEVQWRLEQERLGKYVVSTPFSATIVETFVNEGETVVEGRPMFRLADLHTLHLRIALPASSARSELRVGQQCRLMVRGRTERPVMGTLLTVASPTDLHPGSFEYEFSIPNPDLAIPPGVPIVLSWPE